MLLEIVGRDGFVPTDLETWMDGMHVIARELVVYAK